MGKESSDEEIIIYFRKESEFAFTPFYYDPETYRGIVGPRGDHEPMPIKIKKEFNDDLKKYPQVYIPIPVKRSAFEKLYQAASRRDYGLVKKVIIEEFPAICQ